MLHGDVKVRRLRRLHIPDMSPQAQAKHHVRKADLYHIEGRQQRHQEIQANAAPVGHFRGQHQLCQGGKTRLVEFFLTDTGVVFSELSPRPHDTGMVTLSHSTNLSEFELHLRAVLGLPIHSIKLEHAGASAVVLADKDYESVPDYNLFDVLKEENARIRIFGKPEAHKGRRMAVVLTYGPIEEGTDSLREKAKRLADTVL